MVTVNSIDLSIIILSHNSKEHLKELLPSVFGSEGMNFADKELSVVSSLSDFARSSSELEPPPAPPLEKGGHNIASSLFQREGRGDLYTGEVIIVDNGSSDSTVEWVEENKTLSENFYNCRNFQIMKNANTGFAHGNNLGIKQANGKYILLLNPDTKVDQRTFKTMLDFMESRADIGISGCKIIKPDGTLDLACRRRFPNPANSFKTLFLRDRADYNYIGTDENQSMEVDSVDGAFLLIRRSVMEKIGMLDESFFMYGEDLDWCWRCKDAGFKVWYYPKAFIIHFKGASSAKTPFKSLQWFHEAMWIFYKKHYAKKYSLMFKSVVWFGIYFRFIALSIINFFKSNPKVSQ